LPYGLGFVGCDPPLLPAELARENTHGDHTIPVGPEIVSTLTVIVDREVSTAVIIPCIKSVESIVHVT